MKHTYNILKRLLLGLPGVAVCFFGVACLLASMPALSAEEKLYRTGIKAMPRYFSVSPGGEYLVFDTKKPLGGMRLLDLGTGKIKEIQVERDHLWEMARWSGDGKRLVAISTGTMNGRRYSRYNLDDMKIIVIAPGEWSWRVISPPGDGVKITPFFSPDGTTVYYFKGEARTEGATPAAGYDLYAIDLANGHEEKLTADRFYQVGAGDVSADGRTVYFSKIGGRPLTSETYKSENGFVKGTIIVSLDVLTRELKVAYSFDATRFGEIEGSRFVEIYEPRIDSSGRIYFSGATQRKWSPFVFSLFRGGKSNAPAIRLNDFSNWSRHDIAKRSGNIYVSDTLDGEVIFRRIAVNVNQ